MELKTLKQLLTLFKDTKEISLNLQFLVELHILITRESQVNGNLLEKLRL